ncbi:hypothetical protein FA15DRAFT_621613, partial [Coprinopsis marcescibilis]
MADKNIQPGDEVTWNYGKGHPSGTVAEVQTEAGGKLEIETAGKTVHKNSDPQNPAVHVEREGNDVVKRASELEKTGEAAEKENGKEGETGKGGQEANGEAHPAAAADASSAEKEPPKEAEVGEKRNREDVAKEGGEGEAAKEEVKTAAEEQKEIESAEQDAGKEAKKPKLDEGADAGTEAKTEVQEKEKAPAKRGRGGKAS